MNLQLIRNATLRLDYAGQLILIDPYLAAKHSLPSFTGRSPNPLANLPCPSADVISGVDLTLISHLHTDHFDPLAQQLLPDHMPILCQPGDEDRISGIGFIDVTPVGDEIEWRGIRIQRTPGRHGSSAAVLGDMGEVCGFLLSAQDEPTIYWAGDTVWYEDIAAILDQHQPDIIITHSGGAVWGDNELIVMDAAQTVAVCQHAPAATVIATHLETLDHCLSTRAQLRTAAQAAGISGERLCVPADGESIEMIG